MARTSLILVLGPAALVLALGNQACRFVEDSHGDDVDPVPPALQALLGDDFVVVWTDRDLAWGERVLRVASDGELSTLGDQGSLWVDLDPAQAYRWEGGDLDRTVEPGLLQLKVEDQLAPALAQRGEALVCSLSWEGADPFGLPLALAVERDGEAWLEPSCEDGLPCWRDEPVWWSRWDQGDVPQALDTSWLAELDEPTLSLLEFRLELVRNEVGQVLAVASDRAIETGRQVLWGDLHAHSNLSGDACEDIENSCLPWGDAPGDQMFAKADEAGLDFLALTDHAEHETYLRLDRGTELDAWEQTLALAALAEGGPVIPIVGFEWTGVYNVRDLVHGGNVLGGGHRTIIFDGLAPCDAYWAGAGVFASSKSLLGFEDYIQRSTLLGFPDELARHLAAADASCDPVRHLSWFHHSGVAIPRPVNWDTDMNRELGDGVVEIYSEHGSSECHDATLEGCDWSVLEGLTAGSGSAQMALQQGYTLGFVSGTDSHDGSPGSIEDGPSIVVMGEVDGVPIFQEQTTPGGVTGTLVAGAAPGRVEIVDAIEQRHTVAASWLFDAVRIVAVGQDGQVYLPGDAVPATAFPLELAVEVEDQAVDSWRIEVLDPYGEIHLVVDQGQLYELLELGAGDVRYVRVRAWMQDQEQRLWASPFFGVD